MTLLHMSESAHLINANMAASCSAPGKLFASRTLTKSLSHSLTRTRRSSTRSSNNFLLGGWGERECGGKEVVRTVRCGEEGSEGCTSPSLSSIAGRRSVRSSTFCTSRRVSTETLMGFEGLRARVQD